MTDWFLARARLRRDASLSSLARLLLPEGPEGVRIAAAHRLVWSLFADSPDRRRDFLWCAEADGRLITLSPRPPSDPHGLFELESKEFAPNLATGDRLGFRLRANPVVARKAEGGGPSKRHDVVMDAIRHFPKGERAAPREQAINEAGKKWITALGARAGFAADLSSLSADGYDRVRIPRESGAPMVFGQLDFEGRLTVTEPALFLASLTNGFGRAKAFGCGLMLIRRDLRRDE
jgi:CRISPR system Cascade subunit CasE